MSNNAEIPTENDTFEKMNNSYQLDAAEYDDNDEGTVEYLDLDLEVDQVPESVEEYIPDICPQKTKLSVVQPLILKPSYRKTEKLMHKQTPKLNRAKQQTLIAPISNLLQIKSATQNAANTDSLRQSGVNEINYLASESVHEAVNVINAKLAESVHCINGQGRNNISNERVDFNASTEDESETSQSIKSDIKCEGDSLDLFFQSMAQTVLHLPSQVQAKIKMDVCKVIAMAETKYGISNTAHENKL